MNNFNTGIINCILFFIASFFSRCSYPDPTNNTLWQKETQRLRNVIDTLPDDFEKTTYLRKYCGQLIGVGLITPETYKMYRSLNFSSFQPSVFYPLFDQDSLPADCGISSFFYIKLLQELGYKAYQYSFGFKTPPYQRFVHSFSVVEIEYKGKKRLIIQDPYLNITYRNADMEPIDFHIFLSNLKHRQYQNIIMDSSSVLTSLIIPDTTMYWNYVNDSCKNLLRSRLLRSEGTAKKNISLKRNYKTLMNSYCDPFEEGFIKAMQDLGLREPFMYAYLLKVADMVGSPDVHAVEAKIDSLLIDTVSNNPL